MVGDLAEVTSAEAAIFMTYRSVDLAKLGKFYERNEAGAFSQC